MLRPPHGFANDELLKGCYIASVVINAKLFVVEKRFK